MYLFIHREGFPCPRCARVLVFISWCYVLVQLLAYVVFFVDVGRYASVDLIFRAGIQAVTWFMMIRYYRETKDKDILKLIGFGFVFFLFNGLDHVIDRFWPERFHYLASEIALLAGVAFLMLDNIRQAIGAHRDSILANQYRKLSAIDALTGLGNRNSYLSRLEDLKLSDLNEKQQIPLKVAAGAHQYKPGVDESLQDIIHKADEQMYLQKIRMNMVMLTNMTMHLIVLLLVLPTTVLILREKNASKSVTFSIMMILLLPFLDYAFKDLRIYHMVYFKTIGMMIFFSLVVIEHADKALLSQRIEKIEAAVAGLDRYKSFKICDGTACHVRRSIPIYEALKKELGLDEKNKTSEDMLFTLETVSCLGACGLAPVITINDKVYPKMDPLSTSELIKAIRKEEEDENEN